MGGAVLELDQSLSYGSDYEAGFLILRTAMQANYQIFPARIRVASTGIASARS